jgi:phosphonopyruvate decarboxylase
MRDDTGIAHGAALSRPESRFVVLDGDGAVLMHMGVMATIGANAPANLTHVIFDNGVYDSTGGQRTGCSHMDFASAAFACGYRDARTVDTIDALRAALRSALAAPGPTAIVVRGAAGGPAGERASNKVTVGEIGARFRDSLAAAAPGGRVPA